MTKHAFLLLMLFFMHLQTFAQGEVTGKVVDVQTNDVLPGVTVLLKGKGQTTQTNAEGVFTIQADEADILVVTYTGYTPQEVPVVFGEPLTIGLEVNVQVMDEVVVVGYGTQTRSNLSGAVSSVNSQVLQSAPRTNAATALQGTVAGLRVQQTTGQPGATPSISFRGGTNFDGSGSPLIIVDGVIVPSLYGINPDDIESMDLLKDAASTAIYGARAANGVVLVTTKKGKMGRTQISYNLKMAKNTVRRNNVPFLSAEDYIIWNRRGLGSRYEAAAADGNEAEMNATRNQLTGAWGWAASPGWTQPDGLYSTQLLSQGNRSLLQDPAWNLLIDRNPFDAQQLDSILYRSTSQRELEDLILQNSSLQQHYLNFSGATEKSNFALGLGAVKDIGLVRGSSLKRMNVNFNGGLQVTKDFKINLNLAGYNDRSRPSYLTADGGGGLTGGLIQRFGGVAPTVRLTHDVTGEILPGVDGGTLGNPSYFQDKFNIHDNEQRYSGALNLEYQILPQLKALASASGFIRYNTRETFNKAYQNGTAGAFIDTRNASFSNVRSDQWQYNAFLQYDNTWDKHTLSLLGGGEFYEYQNRFYQAEARGGATDFIPYLSASTEAVGVPASGFDQWQRLSSIIGRANYNYDNRFLFNMNLRYDGSSRLADNRFGFFPGLSAGWNIHNESFYRDMALSNVLSTLKPRISWGQNGSLPGRDVIGDYPAAGVYSFDAIYNGSAGFVPTTIVNSDLRWERVSSLNFGLDLGFFNNRLSVITDYFIRDVYDKITDLQIPSWTGYSVYRTNLGQLQNKGVELEVKAALLQPTTVGGLSWEVGFNFYHVKNYAVRLPDNGLDRNRQGAIEVFDPVSGQRVFVGGLQEGLRIGNDEIWAPIYDGIYTSQEMLDQDAQLINTYLPHINKNTKLLGDARWRDVNGDGTIDFLDRVFVGRTRPTVQGGFSTSFAYKGLSLFVQTDYALGFMLLNQQVLRGLSQVQGSQNGPVDIKDTWHPENPEGTLPRYYWANYGRNYFQDAGGSTTTFANFYEKGDYLALREVTLSYDLPVELLANVTRNRVNGLRLYVSGTNLAYLTGYSGNFPEVGGNDVGRFPLPRTYTFGLNLTL
ncbi:SusC/RagA family TonB-linked outer membrane protein [Olivibacter sp. SDN3]|nr:SusC/RagA family TonB-linked outer membrane protein [Olivibacter sp. SDN3]